MLPSIEKVRTSVSIVSNKSASTRKKSISDAQSQQLPVLAAVTTLEPQLTDLPNQDDIKIALTD